MTLTGSSVAPVKNSVNQKKAMIYHKIHINTKTLENVVQKFLYDEGSKKLLIPKWMQEHVSYCLHNPDYKGPFKCLFQGCGRQYTHLKNHNVHMKNDHRL